MGFDLLPQYDIPYLHPLAVHFPIALLLAAAGAALGYAVRGTSAWRGATLGLLVLGAAGAWFATQTGEALHDAVEGEPIVEAVVGAHATAGEWTARVSTAAALLALGLAGWRRRQPRRPPEAPDPLAARIGLAAAVALAAALAAWTGHLGGIMVWGVPA